jgi:hypothetical protein
MGRGREVTEPDNILKSDHHTTNYDFVPLGTGDFMSSCQSRTGRLEGATGLAGRQEVRLIVVLPEKDLPLHQGR